MSNSANTELLERAAGMIDFWEGTIIAEVIESDVANNDLEGLMAHVNDAEAQAAEEELHSNDAL